MSDACFLSPPANAGIDALQEHLARLRAMDQDDALVRLAIEDTLRLIEEAESAGRLDNDHSIRSS
jgi:hypothetical protein